MAPIGILLMQMPAMLRAIIDDIVAEQSDMRVVGELTGQDDVRVAVERTGASFLIVGYDGAQLPDPIHDLFSGHPSIRVLAVTDQGREATLYELRPQRIPIGELSASRLVAVLRQPGQIVAGGPTGSG